MTHRVGLGYDVHPLVEGRALILGGVRIEHPRGLAGHSDGDALAHALADAVLGALSLGDLGRHFPDDDPRWKDASSLDLLRQVASLAAERGARLENADLVLLADEPRLAPHVEAMRGNLARALGTSIERISIKATRTEGLGPLAGAAGVAVQAVALLAIGEPPNP